MVYDPQGHSKDRTSAVLHFVEAEPPAHLRNIVHRFIDLRTRQDLQDSYRFHALPDACSYAIFDQSYLRVAGVTRLRAAAEELDLGTCFHFVNVRFLPGVWQRDQCPVGYGLVKSAYQGALPLIEVNQSLNGLGFEEQQTVLTRFVEGLVQDRIVVPNPVTQKIFAALGDIYSVADMAQAAQLSARQLQRVLNRDLGLAPHDFLKVIRLQQVLRGEPSLAYADQSHFIHSFRKATGYTPGQYAKTFDV